MLKTKTRWLEGLQGAERQFGERYLNDVALVEIATDLSLGRGLWPAATTEFARNYAAYRLSNQLIKQGKLPRLRSAEQEQRLLAEAQQKSERKQALTDLQTIAERSFNARELEVYEQFLQLQERRTLPRRPPTSGRVEYVVFGDPHVPDERIDLIETIMTRHPGAHCVVAGDLNDWEKYSRFDKEGFDLIAIQDAFQRTDDLVRRLSEAFGSVTLMFGNHDMRLPKLVSSKIGPDLHWVTHQFLVNCYQNRHGAYLVDNHIVKANGRIVKGVHYFHQLGDCIVSHAETCGSTPSKGVLMAAKHFRQFDGELGLDPFRVVLQAHTHKRSYYYDPLIKVHCFEIGATCDTGTYAFRKQTFGPVQPGYFHLIQEDGETRLDQSRLYMFD